MSFSFEFSLGSSVGFTSTAFQFSDEIIDLLPFTVNFGRVLNTSSLFLSAKVVFSSLFRLKLRLEGFTTSKLRRPRRFFIRTHLTDALFFRTTTSVFFGDLLPFCFCGETHRFFGSSSSAVLLLTTSLFFRLTARSFALPVRAALIFASSDTRLFFATSTKFILSTSLAFFFLLDSTLQRLLPHSTLRLLSTTLVLSFHTQTLFGLIHLTKSFIRSLTSTVLGLNSFSFLSSGQGSSSVSLTTSLLFCLTLFTFSLGSVEKILLCLHSSSFLSFTLQLLLGLEFLLTNHVIDSSRIFHGAPQALLRVEDDVSLVLLLLATLLFLLLGFFLARELFLMELILASTVVFFGAKTIFSLACRAGGVVVGASTVILGLPLLLLSVFSRRRLCLGTGATLIFIRDFALFCFFKQLNFFKLRLVLCFSRSEASLLFSIDARKLLNVLLTTVLLSILESDSELLELFKSAALLSEIIVFRIASVSLSLGCGSHGGLGVRRTNFFCLQRGFHILLSASGIVVSSITSILDLVFKRDDGIFEVIDVCFRVTTSLIFVIATSSFIFFHIEKSAHSVFTSPLLLGLTIGFFTLESSTLIIDRSSDIISGLFTSSVFGFFETTFLIELTCVFVIPSASTSFLRSAISGKTITHRLELGFCFSTATVLLILQTSLAFQQRASFRIETRSDIGFLALRSFEVHLCQLDVFIPLRASLADVVAQIIDFPSTTIDFISKATDRNTIAAFLSHEIIELTLLSFNNHLGCDDFFRINSFAFVVQLIDSFLLESSSFVLLAA